MNRSELYKEGQHIQTLQPWKNVICCMSCPFLLASFIVESLSMLRMGAVDMLGDHSFFIRFIVLRLLSY